MIYHGIFSSIIRYGCQVWGQANQTSITLGKVQNKALRIINFTNFRASCNKLYYDCKVLKLEDNIKLSNFLFAYDCYTKNLPASLNNKLHLAETGHELNTRNTQYKSFIVPTVRTRIFGLNRIQICGYLEFIEYIIISNIRYTKPRKFHICDTFYAPLATGGHMSQIPEPAL